MRRLSFHAALMILSIGAAWSGSPARGHDIVGERFFYDEPGELRNGIMLEGENLYEPSVVRQGDRVLVAVLAFTPGEGDRIVVGEWIENEFRERRLVVEKIGQYRNPTLTVGAAGGLWLSYEALEAENWQVHVRLCREDLQFGEPIRVSTGFVSSINHAVAPMKGGGIAVVWQGDRDGQWDIHFRTISTTGLAGATQVLTSNPLGDWHPAIAAGGDGELTVVWDAYDGESFSVRARTNAGARWGDKIAVTQSPAFEARAAVAYDREGRLFVSWEEGELHWGKEYRGSLRDADLLTDAFGPVHRFRMVRVAEILEGGEVVPLAFPLPTLAVAAKREGAVEGRVRLGVFYERAVLTVDEGNRLWVVYRHYYYPEVALPGRPTSHVEEGWRLYARCFSGGKWSESIGLEPNQRDGMQRLSVAPGADGFIALWTTGRTHRAEKEPETGPRGVAAARVEAGAALEFLDADESGTVAAGPMGVSAGSGEREPGFAPKKVGEIEYQLFMGDLHRHTDLSLCRVYFDGTLDDAYRYAIEAAELDFLGVTDHGRDLGDGDVRSQAWWRSVKEVTRHRLKGAFFPLFAYERSHAETDHNVISLRNDVLWPYQPPLKDFWETIGRDTITIPHNPIRPLRAFAFQDDEKRPLLEMYQGCRDNPMQKEAHAGLARGHHMGFIASSDHLATRTSYACVWSPSGGAEPIFRALQARRTYGATDKIRLVFQSGIHWMGEVVEADSMPVFRFAVDGTGPIERVDVYRDGAVVDVFVNEDGDARMEVVFKGQGELMDTQYFYVHVIQEDGEQAWSSPIWVEAASPQ